MRGGGGRGRGRERERGQRRKSQSCGLNLCFQGCFEANLPKVHVTCDTTLTPDPEPSALSRRPAVPEARCAGGPLCRNGALMVEPHPVVQGRMSLIAHQCGGQVSVRTPWWQRLTSSAVAHEYKCGKSQITGCSAACLLPFLAYSCCA